MVFGKCVHKVKNCNFGKDINLLTLISEVEISKMYTIYVSLSHIAIDPFESLLITASHSMLQQRQISSADPTIFIVKRVTTIRSLFDPQCLYREVDHVR